MNRLKIRKFKSKLLKITVLILASIAAIPLAAIIYKVTSNGIGGFSISFFTESAPTAYKIIHGEQGGILAGIVGSALMLTVACIIAIPVGILSGVALSEYRKRKFSKIISFLTDLLQGTPSIVIGIVTYASVVIYSGGYSGFAGSIALAIIMIPLVTRSTEESLNIIEENIKEAGMALGSTKSATVFKIMIPHAFGGIFTGILLALSRVMGETAPLMFTALGCMAVRFDMTKPMSGMPLLIWQFWTDAKLQNLVWSAALFLLIVVLGLNMIAYYIKSKKTV